MDTPSFQQTLQRNRPHELLLEGADPFRCGQLKYRYLDTQEIVLVPNLWYNQTPDMRAQSYEAQADQLEQLAASMAKRPSHLMLPQEAQNLANHYRQQAMAFRAQAARFRGESLRQVAERSQATAPQRESVARKASRSLRQAGKSTLLQPALAVSC